MSLRARGDVGAGGRAGSGCLFRSCYQALAAVGSASWRVGQPVSLSKDALWRRVGCLGESACIGFAAQVICCKGGQTGRRAVSRCLSGLVWPAVSSGAAMPCTAQMKVRDGVCRSFVNVCDVATDSLLFFSH
jgi:hypothetical protein